MQVARLNRYKKAEVALAAQVLMEARSFSPIEKLMDLHDEEVDPPNTGDADRDKSILNTMLFTDWEMKENGKLRLKVRPRMDILFELARYAHPRLKATEEAGAKGTGSVTVLINNHQAPAVAAIVQKS
jgi:hypothetical protein